MQDGDKSPKTIYVSVLGSIAGLILQARWLLGGFGRCRYVCCFFLRCVHGATRGGGDEGEYADTCHKLSIGNGVEDSRCEIQCFICSMLSVQSTDFTISTRRYARRCEGSAMANPLHQAVEK